MQEKAARRVFETDIISLPGMLLACPYSVHVKADPNLFTDETAAGPRRKAVKNQSAAVEAEHCESPVARHAITRQWHVANLY